jgi:hypothetical protein
MVPPGIPVPPIQGIPTSPILEQMIVLLAQGIPVSDPQIVALVAQYSAAKKTLP